MWFEQRRRGRISPEQVLADTTGVLDPPVDVHTVASCLGIRIVVRDVPFLDDRIAQTSAHDDLRVFPRIELGLGLSPFARRSAVALGIGHVLTSPLPFFRRGETQETIQLIVPSDPETPAYRARACSFALGLLVPAWMLEIYQADDPALDHLASLFAVPSDVIRRLTA